MKQKVILLFLALGGLLDSLYLTYEHFAGVIPPCASKSFFVDCGIVLRSVYATPFGIPLALIGIIHYSLLFLIISLPFISRKPVRLWLLFQTTVGVISSIYFVYLQLIVLKSICLYCMLSASISFLLFGCILFFFEKERKYCCIRFMSFSYRHILKPVFFNFDAEKVHVGMTIFGEVLGKIGPAKSIFRFLLQYRSPILKQELHGMQFENPIGLAAGFDYEARLTQILEPVGFGFQTIGTITNIQYEGNPKPRLGRLPRSKSLMVNKGFKNPGAIWIIKKLSFITCHIPYGISIGRTNTRSLVTQEKSIDDIISAFIRFEKSSLTHSYYELNISCPNLYGTVTFYPPKNLEQLLKAVDSLHLKRPLFIKMPIEKSDKELEQMLKVIDVHSVQGVIFGNLQKNRQDTSLIPEEVKQFSVGNFSGKPTFEQSNHCIELTYSIYKKRFTIIGCGGVFTAEDAYKKIKLGASLIQLITGMIYEGPQVITEIQMGLIDLLHKDGYKHISQAVGADNTFKFHN